MPKPERADLEAALLAITPARRRERAPGKALEDASRTAGQLLAAWPKEPRHVPSPSADTIRVIDWLDGVAVDILPATHGIILETAGVRLLALVRNQRLEVQVDPVGTDFMHRLDIDEARFSGIQLAVRVKGGPL